MNIETFQLIRRKYTFYTDDLIVLSKNNFCNTSLMTLKSILMYSSSIIDLKRDFRRPKL